MPCLPPSPGSQAESKQAGQSVFRRGLLDRLQREYRAREQLRARSLQSWVCYVTFICNIFDYLRVRHGQSPCAAVMAGLRPKAKAGWLPLVTNASSCTSCSPHR